MKVNLCLALAALAVAAVALAPAPAADADGVAIKVGDDRIDFHAGKALVASYRKGADVAKPYFWPVIGPGGAPLTRAWPMLKGQPGESTDHPHQKSAWFCHGDVIPEGIPLKQKIKGVEGVDFWSESPGHGRIVCVHVGEPKVNKDHAQVTTRNEWRTADGTKVLDETRTIHLYDLGAAKLFVLNIDLHASVCPITFGDTKEGSMGIRINDDIRATKGKEKGPGRIENAEGKVGEKECWGGVSAWCDYSGPLGGKTVGLAILADPANPYSSCWHARGYGLMAANPFGRNKSGFPAMRGKTDLVKLAKGEHLKLRYGILLHPGDAKEGKVAEHYARFVKLKG
ncbi:MAG TPA: PmoA family protein [Gemmataceae bacterium]|nr:PmoA family protein [Gemmataceae bacterium]